MRRRRKSLKRKRIFLVILVGIFLFSGGVVMLFLLYNSVSRLPVVATGYSSTHGQTDSTPFITATGDEVFDGLVAANFLDFGTKIMIPKLFGSRVLTVKDRMNRRFTDRYPHHIDVWFDEEGKAKNFGVQTADIVVLKNSLQSTLLRPFYWSF